MITGYADSNKFVSFEQVDMQARALQYMMQKIILLLPLNLIVMLHVGL